jgi:gliding motility-associated-like protein
VKNWTLILLLFIPLITWSQLSDFNFSVSATNETCIGNGSIQMTVSGTTPGSQILYDLYLAPDFNNPVATTTQNIFASLTAGNYQVIATQSLNGEFNSQTQTLVIENLLNPIDFEISFTCQNSVEITVVVISGNPLSFEIISGPELRPAQTSNVFSNLPVGNYSIRLVDACNDAVVKDFNLLNIELSYGEPELPEIIEVCDPIPVTQTISSDFQYQYPLQITYELFIPDADSITFEYFLTEGETNMLTLVQDFPTFADAIYPYSIKVVDICGRTWTRNFTFNPNPELSLNKAEIECNQFLLNISIQTFKPPYQLEFVTAPADFDPYFYYPNFDNGFSAPILVFGYEEFPVPYGFYQIKITDSCGRTAISDEDVTPEEVTATVTGINNGCGSDLASIQGFIGNGREVVSATMLSAPSEYGFETPHDVSNFINPDGFLVVTNVPIGFYAVLLVDNCGQEYVEEVEILPFEPAENTLIVQPNCDPLFGSVRIFSGNGAIIQMTITQAPQTFEFDLPFDASSFINPVGVFFMQDLPAGSYRFSFIDSCGFETQMSANVLGYKSNNGIYSLQRNCGSFNINITDTDTRVTDKSYWFQRLNPANNTWGHPYTGVAYTEGQLPNETNSILLEFQVPLLNIFLTGEFRIIKAFRSLNASDAQNQCLDVLNSFTIGSGITVLGAYTLDCEGGLGGDSIVLDVLGVGPFQASIISPFVFDNGNNLVFENLAQGLYTFQVSDACGNVQNINIELGVLTPLVRAQTPTSLLVCRELPFNDAAFVFSNQTPTVLGNQNPNNYIVSYHLSQEDADSGNNPLPSVYTNVTNPQTIFVRVEHIRLDFCYATTSFPVFIGRQPVINSSIDYFLCEGETTIISAEPGYDAYEWNTGETTRQIIVSEPGIYSVLIKNIYQDFSCDIDQEILVTGSGIATIEEVISSDWTSDQNSFLVDVSGSGDYQYSLDGIQYQSSSLFTNLSTGLFTVFVKDLNGCGVVSEDVLLLYYPNFFTPNGDGDNDTWRIKFSGLEPGIRIEIYDRYGKLITGLDPYGMGWDGTLNGRPLPSTDYWFVVTRANGKVHKGHFAMKR